MNIKIAVENLRDIKCIFDKNDVDYWLDLGTLLGAVRDGKIIEWDNDIDLGTWFENVEQITSAFPEFKKRGFTVVLTMKKIVVGIMRDGCHVEINMYRKIGDFAWNVWVVTEKRLEKLLRSFMTALSLSTYTKPEGKLVRKSEPFLSLLPLKSKQPVAETIWSILDKFGCIIPLVIPKHYFEKLSRIKFYGMQFNAPAYVEKYLEFRYGINWRIPNKKWIYYKDDGAINRNWSTRT